MSVEELLTRWTIRLSLLLYAVALGALLVGRFRGSIIREARLVWTAGCALIWLHLAAAFQFYHRWSHQAAYDATARDTELTIGWAFGGGVYFNYLFAVVWTADVAWWWSVAPHAYFARSRWLAVLAHGFLFFMVVNATVTFGDGVLRWVAAAISVSLATLTLVTLPTRHRKNDEGPGPFSQ